MRFVFRHLPAALGINLLLAVSLTLTVLEPGHPWPGLLWPLAHAGLTAAGVLAARAFRRQPRQALALWRGGLTLGGFLLGGLWGLAMTLPLSASALPLPLPVLTSVLITMVSAVTCGATLLLAPLPSASLAFLLPAVLPLGLRLLAADTVGCRLLGVSGLVFALAMTVVSAKIRHWMEATLASSHERDALTRQLLEANAALHGYRDELESTIWARTLALRDSNAQLQLEIAAKEKARLKAAHAEARYRTLFEEMGDGYARLDAEDRFLFANPAAERIFGVAPGTLPGRSLSGFLAPEQNLTRQLAISLGLRTQPSKGLHEIVRLDGEPRWLQVRISPVWSPDGQFVGTAALFQDCTEQRRDQDARRKAQQLESLGTLAGGVARTFNNLMGAILGNLDLARLNTPPGTPAAGFLANLESAANRSLALTRQMLIYSGSAHAKVLPVDLGATLAGLAELLGAGLHPGATLSLELAPGLPAIAADPVQLRQTLVSLVSNAAEALDGGPGHLHLATRAVDLDPAAAAGASRLLPVTPGAHVLLEVHNPGCAIKAAVESGLQGPSFTTQESGRGLARVLDLLKTLGAGLEIHSEPGQGNRIRLYFPVAPSAPTRPAPALPRGRRPFRDKVLLVDEDPNILETSAAMLAAMGLDVLTARDGQEAMERFQSHGGEIGLVLLDLAMPRLDGQQAFLALRNLKPSLPVILVSGDEARFAEGPGSGAAGPILLKKPYSLKVLRATLEEALRAGDLTLA